MKAADVASPASAHHGPVGKPALLFLSAHHQHRAQRVAVPASHLVGDPGANASTGEEIWIPRRFVGEVSRINDPVLIVGLLKELEYKGGAVWPYQRRVIEMPIAVGERSRTAVPATRRTGPGDWNSPGTGTDSKIGRLIGGALLVGIVACFLVVTMHRGGLPSPRLMYTAKDQSYLELGPNDDYYSVVRKLGDAGSRPLEIGKRSASVPRAFLSAARLYRDPDGHASATRPRISARWTTTGTRSTGSNSVPAAARVPCCANSPGFSTVTFHEAGCGLTCCGRRCR